MEQKWEKIEIETFFKFMLSLFTFPYHKSCLTDISCWGIKWDQLQTAPRNQKNFQEFWKFSGSSFEAENRWIFFNISITAYFHECSFYVIYKRSLIGW